MKNLRGVDSWDRIYSFILKVVIILGHAGLSTMFYKHVSIGLCECMYVYVFVDLCECCMQHAYICHRERRNTLPSGSSDHEV